MDAKTFLADRQLVIETTMKVINKQGQLVDFRLKPAQAHYIRGAKRNNLLPKARQMGFTTVALTDNLLECCLVDNTNFLLLVQTDEDVAPTHDKMIALYESMRPNVKLDDVTLRIRPDIAQDSAHRTVFKNGSQVLIRTANSKSVGRSMPFHRVHGTEVAFWDDGDANRVVPAILGASSDISRFRFTLESTGNGPSGLFYTLCSNAQQGIGVWNLMFYNWLWEPGYMVAGDALGEMTPEEQRIVAELHATDDQLRWRRRELERYKVLKQEDDFKLEFPTWLKDCFTSRGAAVFTEEEKGWAAESIAEPISVSRDGALRVWQCPESRHGYIVRADPSSGTAEDPAAAVVLDALTMEHVATLEGWFEPHVLADRLVDIATYYNYAYVSVERNTGYGQAVGRQLVEIRGYQLVEYGDDGKFGIHTNEQSKATMVSDIKQAIAESNLVTHDQRVLDEMQTYIRNRNKVRAASKRDHDDVLMCLMGAVSTAMKYPHLRYGGGTMVRRMKG